MSVRDIQFVHKFWNMLNQIDQAAGSSEHIHLEDPQTRLEFEKHLQDITSEVLAVNQSASVEDICETLLSYVQQIKQEELNDVRISFFANFLLLLGKNEYCWQFFEIMSETDNKSICEKSFIELAFVYCDLFKKPHLPLEVDDQYCEMSRLLYNLLITKGIDRFQKVFGEYKYLQKQKKEYFLILCDMAKIAIKEYTTDRITEILSDSDSFDFDEDYGISKN